jgi:DNA-binding beta-propeller fold protein YncE
MNVRLFTLRNCIAAATLALPGLAGAQIHAMFNYETKSPESMKALKSPVQGAPRREGIAIIDVDPQSKSFGKILEDIPLPPDLVAHHIFYNRDMSKIYVTALGKGEMRVIDMHRKPYALKTIDVAECQVGEDIVFSDDNTRWYLTCMGSANMIVGDAVRDVALRSVKLPAPYPHGIAVHEGIDRVLLTSTVRPADGGDPGEVLSVMELSTGKSLGTRKVSLKPSPSGEAPVEVLFVPNADPPLAYVTTLGGGTLWTARWNPERKDFDVAQAYDFGQHGDGAALEMYFNKAVDRMYVTTAKPGRMHIFDVKGANLMKPRLLKTIPAAEGAHHIAFTKDGRYAYVQNALLNLPGMSDGSVTVVDMRTHQVIRSMDTLKLAGLNPNCMVLLPEWNDPAGH